MWAAEHAGPVRLAVRVLVVKIRIVGVAMREHLMAMAMRVWPGCADAIGVLVLVVFVVHVMVIVLERLVRVFVLVALAHMQPHAQLY